MVLESRQGFKFGVSVCMRGLRDLSGWGYVCHLATKQASWFGKLYTWIDTKQGGRCFPPTPVLMGLLRKRKNRLYAFLARYFVCYESIAFNRVLLLFLNVPTAEIEGLV